MVTISDFVLDRIGEEEFLAHHMIRRHGTRYLKAVVRTSDPALNPDNPWNVLARCANRRELVAAYAVPEGSALAAGGPADALRALAAVWSHHPDYRLEWAPRVRVPHQVGIG